MLPWRLLSLSEDSSPAPPNQKPGSRTPQSQPPRAQSRDSRDATRLLLIRPLRVFAIAIAFHLAQATGSSKHRSETPVTALLLPHTLVFAIRKGKKKQSLDRKPRDDRPRPPAIWPRRRARRSRGRRGRRRRRGRASRAT
ncbi:hypothetical protein VUR80DRAFT_640 [Thermomyces stellatus]